MSVSSKFHRPSHVDRTSASQGTREDATPAGDLNFETYQEEYDHLVSEKRRVEIELTGCNKAAFAAVERSLRREHSNDRGRFNNAWHASSSAMHETKQDLTKEWSSIEAEIARVKPLMKSENRRLHLTNRSVGDSLGDFPLFRTDGTLSWDGIATRLLLELQAIRRFLEHKD